MTSKHYSKDRQEREKTIEMIGQGTPVAEFVVDNGHRNGPTIHVITSTGIINIYNQRTHKLVTKLVARPGQIRRYYKNGNAPKELVEKAYNNTVKHNYNRWKKWLRIQIKKQEKKRIIKKE